MITDPDWRRRLELSVALEIAKAERDAFQAQADLLRAQLERVTRRAEKAEDRLHETTVMLCTLSRDAIAASARSLATEVMVDGKSVLRLSNPVVQVGDTQSGRRKHQ